MKSHRRLLLPCALALSALAPHAWAAPVITDWTSYTWGTNGSASGNLGGIGVTYSGDVRDLQNNHGTVFDNSAGGYFGQTVYTPSLDVSDALGTWGSTGVTNTITFTSAVLNPILWINSLGRGGAWDLSTYVQTWTFSSPFSLLSSLNVLSELPNPYKMTQSGNSLIGQEGHGSIQFIGSYTSISWTSNKLEQSAYFQVGYDNSIVPSTVPDQGSMLLLPLAFGGLMLCRQLGRRSRVRP
ncbi:MAG: hypothetical protein HZC55_18530 [Verrucomicrobia bacterium]|nr:hypothetical protein [Verrucomicrobiota bacterium]